MTLNCKTTLSTIIIVNPGQETLAGGDGDLNMLIVVDHIPLQPENVDDSKIFMKEGVAVYSKAPWIAFLIIIAFGIIAILRGIWLMSSTRVSIHFMADYFLISLMLPLLIIIIIATIYAVRAKSSIERALPFAGAFLLSLPIIILSLTIFLAPSLRPEPVLPLIRADLIRTTDDGLFEYRLEFITVRGQSSARLLVKDLIQAEEFYIEVDIPIFELWRISTPHSGYFLWARLGQGREPGQYLLQIPPGQASQTTFINGVRFENRVLRSDGQPIRAAFLIDIPSRTATRVRW